MPVTPGTCSGRPDPSIFSWEPESEFASRSPYSATSASTSATASTAGSCWITRGGWDISCWVRRTSRGNRPDESLAETHGGAGRGLAHGGHLLRPVAGGGDADRFHRFRQDLPRIPPGAGSATAVRSAGPELAQRSRREGEGRHPAARRGARSDAHPVGAQASGEGGGPAEGDPGI